VNLQCIASVIINEAQFPKPVHEKANPRAACAHHLRQSFLTEFGDSNLGLSILAEARQQEQKASQSFLTGIEKLVNQVLFVSDVPRQQIRHEHIGKRVFPVKHFHHGLLIDSHHGAITHCGRGALAERLPCKANFSEEVGLVENACCGFLSPLRHNCESYLSFPYIKNGIGRVALKTLKGDLCRPIDELPRPFPWDIRARSLRRRFGFQLSFSYFLTTQAAIGPRQRLQSLVRNITGTGSTYAICAVSNSPERCFDHPYQAPTLARLLEQRFLSNAADGLVASVLRTVNIQRPCFACQPTEEPDSIFPPGLKLPPVLPNLCFFHSLHNSSSCVTKTPYA
jgi:hypothetical protein